MLRSLQTIQLYTKCKLYSLRTCIRSELGLVMLDGCVYAVGGWEGRSRLDSVERLVHSFICYHSFCYLFISKIILI